MIIGSAACLKCVLLGVKLQILEEEIGLADTVIRAAWLAMACSETRIALNVTSVECESSLITIGYAAFCCA